MKTIGIIGGLSYESTLEYYRIINEYTNKRLDGLHSAKSIVYSFDFEEIELLQHQGKWAEATERMVEAAKTLETAGADLLLISSNTMHKMAGEIQESVKIPLLHIADPTARKIEEAGIKCVGLIGTRFTMEHDFYKGRLEKRGLKVVVPDENERQHVHNIIYRELCKGIINQESKAEYVRIINNLAEQGARGIILGCTEICLLVKETDTSLPTFDTTRIHAEAAAEAALEDTEAG